MTGQVGEGLTSDLDRLVDRLRSVPEYRLTRPLAALGGQDLATATYQVACWCVAAEAGVVDRAEAAPPVPHPLPRVAELSSGDQLHVVAADLVRAVSALPIGELVWLDGGRAPVAEVVDGLTRRLARLRAAS